MDYNTLKRTLIAVVVIVLVILVATISSGCSNINTTQLEEKLESLASITNELEERIIELEDINNGLEERITTLEEGNLSISKVIVGTNTYLKNNSEAWSILLKMGDSGEKIYNLWTQKDNTNF
jgi:outer membrane murein-binding lipoprotein Lpp